MKDSGSILLRKPTSFATASKADIELGSPRKHMPEVKQSLPLYDTKDAMSVHMLKPLYGSHYIHGGALSDVSGAAQRQQVMIDPSLQCRFEKGLGKPSSPYFKSAADPHFHHRSHQVEPSASALLRQLAANNAISDLYTKHSPLQVPLQGLVLRGTRPEFQDFNQSMSANNVLLQSGLLNSVQPTRLASSYTYEPISQSAAQYEKNAYSLGQTWAVETLRAIANPHRNNVCIRHFQQRQIDNVDKSLLRQETDSTMGNVHEHDNIASCASERGANKTRNQTKKRSLTQEKSLKSSPMAQKKRRKLISFNSKNPDSQICHGSDSATKCEGKLSYQKRRLRGITQRPSGKWEAQCWYASKSRYVGVYDSPDEAALAYEVARELLQGAISADTSAEDMNAKISEARDAAQAAVAVFLRKKQTQH